MRTQSTEVVAAKRICQVGECLGGAMRFINPLSQGNELRVLEIDNGGDSTFQPSMVAFILNALPEGGIKDGDVPPIADMGDLIEHAIEIGEGEYQTCPGFIGTMVKFKDKSFHTILHSNSEGDLFLVLLCGESDLKLKSKMTFRAALRCAVPVEIPQTS